MRPRKNEVEVERDVQVTMGDGMVLLTDVYHPVGVDAAPTIPERAPYGRRGIASVTGPEFAARATIPGAELRGYEGGHIFGLEDPLARPDIIAFTSAT